MRNEFSLAADAQFLVITHSRHPEKIRELEQLAADSDVELLDYGVNRGLAKSWNEGILWGYDRGAYFVTICTKGRRPLFADGAGNLPGHFADLVDGAAYLGDAPGLFARCLGDAPAHVAGKVGALARYVKSGLPEEDLARIDPPFVPWDEAEVLAAWHEVAQRARGACGRDRVPLDAVDLSVHERAETLTELDSALERLSELDQRLGDVVECRFFGGLNEEEIAAALGVTSRTVRRDWAKARGLLYAWLAPDEQGSNPADARLRRNNRP